MAIHISPPSCAMPHTIADARVLSVVLLVPLDAKLRMESMPSAKRSNEPYGALMMPTVDSSPNIGPISALTVELSQAFPYSRDSNLKS